MTSKLIGADHRHVTGHHEFYVFGEDGESQPLLAVRAGIPISEVLSVAENIFECIAEFEYEIRYHGPQSPMSTWASRWLLMIAEALVVAAKKGNIGALKKQ